MKNIKKLLSILMVLTLVLALGAQAFADAGKTIVTIEDGAKDHTYQAYKVFSGTTTTIEDEEVLAYIQWANENGDQILAALRADGTIGSKFSVKAEDGSETIVTAEDVAEVMGKLSADEAKALARVLLANKALLGAGIPIVSGETALDPGYYAIVDETTFDADAENATYNAVVLEVVGDKAVINNKLAVPSSEKKVQDVNDTTGNKTGWQDSADYDIGDAVPFQITGTLPANYGEYATYAITFHDEQSAGLTFSPDSVVVTVAGKTLNKGTDYNVVTTDLDDDCTFHVVITDLKAVAPEAVAGNTVVVTYNSTVNSSALIGAKGNPNTMYMEFSNNPSGSGTGRTPDDTVIVFTYDFTVNKVDANSKPLSGAEFALYKEVGESYESKDGEDIVYVNPKTGETKTEAAEGFVKCVAITLSTKDAADGTKDAVFYTERIDDGKYILVETKAPNGYNKADPKEFEISAKHDEGSADPKLTELKAPEDMTVTHDGEDIKGLETSVVNQSGLELPETGGIGTTIFYVVGGILVVAAVILLVTRRRVSGSEK